MSIIGIYVYPSNLDIDIAKTGQLTLFLNAGAVIPDISWESDNPEIASVNENGLVTGKWVGDTTVTATTTDGGYAATCSVTVGWVPTTGNVDSFQKISDTEGGFTGTLDNGDLFGSSVTSPGDLDGDGTADLVVGARLDIACFT